MTDSYTDNTKLVGLPAGLCASADDLAEGQLKINSIVTTVQEQHQLNSCIDMNIRCGMPSALLIEQKCIQP